jgi:hypothetical protein
MRPVSTHPVLHLAGLALATAVSVVTLTSAAGQAPAAAAADNTLTAAEKAAGWELLFDGTAIDKWRGYRATGVPANWSVVGGTIHAAKGQGADLISTGEYGDFEFAVDFNIAKNGNSGLFFRGVESEKGPIYHSAPEFQIIDNDGHPDAKNGPDRWCGANYAIDAPAVNACHAPGEWNSARIVAKGAHVEHWVNGKKTADYELWSPEWKAKVAKSKFNAWPEYGMARSGHLALQAHGDEVSFRNLKVRPLK